MSSSKPRRSNARSAADQLRRYLQGGVRTRREAEAYLARRGAPAPAIAEALEACQREGLLNDGAAARLWAEHWARQGYARAAIAQKLHEKGLDDTSSTHALDRLERDTSDRDRARQLVADERRRAAAPPGRPRLARLLAARGFDPELIGQVVAESLGPPSDEEP